MTDLGLGRYHRNGEKIYEDLSIRPSIHPSIPPSIHSTIQPSIHPCIYSSTKEEMIITVMKVKAIEGN